MQEGPRASKELQEQQAFVLKPCSLVGEMSHGVGGLLKCKLKFSEM